MLILQSRYLLKPAEHILGIFLLAKVDCVELTLTCTNYRRLVHNFNVHLLNDLVIVLFAFGLYVGV